MWKDLRENTDFLFIMALKLEVIDVGSPPVALVVDDNDSMRSLCEDVLETAGFRVLGAGNVDEAQNYMLERNLIFVLTDYHLRGRQTGIQVLEMLSTTAQGSERLDERLGVLMSGYQRNDLLIPPKFKVVPALRKPFENPELLRYAFGAARRAGYSVDTVERKVQTNPYQFDTTKKPCALVVDDEEGYVFQLQTLFTMHGFDVLCAESVEEINRRGLLSSECKNLAVFVVDYHLMPDDGLDFLIQARSAVAQPTLAAIISGQHEEQFRDGSLRKDKGDPYLIDREGVYFSDKAELFDFISKATSTIKEKFGF